MKKPRANLLAGRAVADDAQYGATIRPTIAVRVPTATATEIEKLMP